MALVKPLIHQLLCIALMYENITQNLGLKLFVMFNVLDYLIKY